MTVAAVERTLAVIEALAGQPAPLELSDLAARTGLPASAAHRTLSTLLARGWVVQDAHSQNYALSLRMPMLAFRSLDMRFVPPVLQAALDRLAATTREYCRLALVEADTLTWVARAQGAEKGLRYDPDMGAEIVLHATANGKAWLSTLPEEQALALARQGLGIAEDTGPNCVRSAEALREHLRKTRMRGYATSIEEAELGTSAVAVPVRGGTASGDPVVGTISVAGPTLRITAERIEPLARALQATADEIAQLWPLHLRQRTRISVGKAAAE
jgi:DNA-binding IclR family transcriptional regulator